MIFTRFERLWHWSQAVLVLGMMVTGFEVAGSYALVGYGAAVTIHAAAAWALLGLWALALFWHIVTGEWRQYIPTTEKLSAVVHYYTRGIFDPEVRHPWRVSPSAKHNPLQRLAYAGFGVVLMPVLWMSGLVYMFHDDWAGSGAPSLTLVAGVHLAAAFGMLCFFIGHVYMAFTAKPVTKYVKAMVTGYEDEPDDKPQPAE
jgi:thiosulfate reductase cytochrome b subunit